MDSRLFGIPTAKKNNPRHTICFIHRNNAKQKKVKQKYTHNTKTEKSEERKRKAHTQSRTEKNIHRRSQYHEKITAL